MPDIKLTLSRDKNIAQEAAHMAQLGGLSYPLNKHPKRAGAWVYFILCDQLVARATAVEIRNYQEHEQIRLIDAAGNDIWKPGWWVECSGMVVLQVPLPSAGFEGFRYVVGEEKEAFEELF